MQQQVRTLTGLTENPQASLHTPIAPDPGDLIAFSDLQRYYVDMVHRHAYRQNN